MERGALRFSVVIPCYNGSGHLLRALESVAAQTLAAHEVLVCDDASTDGSPLLARRTGATVLTTSANGGPSAARNRGIAQARGDVVAFLDADDLWQPTHLATLADTFAAVTRADVAFAGARDTAGRTIADANRWPPRTAVDLRWQLLVENPLAQSGTGVRLPALRAAGGYDVGVRLAEDYDLWLRLARGSRFACTGECSVTYRRHAAQASRDLAAMCDAMWAARERAFAALVAAGPPDDVVRARALLLSAWDADLSERWHVGAGDEFDALLAQHARVPDSAVLYRRWRRRRTWIWEAWLGARRVARRLPAPWVERLRRLRPPATSRLAGPPH